MLLEEPPGCLHLGRPLQSLQHAGPQPHVAHIDHQQHRHPPAPPSSLRRPHGCCRCRRAAAGLKKPRAGGDRARPAHGASPASASSPGCFGAPWPRRSLPQGRLCPEGTKRVSLITAVPYSRWEVPPGSPAESSDPFGCVKSLSFTCFGAAWELKGNKRTKFLSGVPLMCCWMVKPSYTAP